MNQDTSGTSRVRAIGVSLVLAGGVVGLLTLVSPGAGQGDAVESTPIAAAGDYAATELGWPDADAELVAAPDDDTAVVVISFGPGGPEVEVRLARDDDTWRVVAAGPPLP